jgi:hypothetical protein
LSIFYNANNLKISLTNESLISILISFLKEYSSRLDDNPLKTQNYTITYAIQDKGEKIGFIKKFITINVTFKLF